MSDIVGHVAEDAGSTINMIRIRVNDLPNAHTKVVNHGNQVNRYNSYNW